MLKTFKLVLSYPLWKLRNRKAKRISKKSRKHPDHYSGQWKYDWILKKSIKVNKIAGVKVSVEGYENIPKGAYLLLPNHQSYIDIPVLVEATKKQTFEKDIMNKRVVFLAKEELAKDKKWANFANMNDTFYIDRKSPRAALETLKTMGKYIKEHKIGGVIFPEGTRSKDGNMLDFKGGAVAIAKKEYIPIVPVTINNTFLGTNFKRKGKLYVNVVFHQPLKPMTFITQDNKSLAKRVENIVKSKWKFPETNLNEVGKK